MSVVGLMDLRINVYRIDDGSVNPTNRLGEPGPSDGAKPTSVQSFLRASIQLLGFAHAEDKGAGEWSVGRVELFVEGKAKLQLGDIIYVTTGPMAPSWWHLVQVPFRAPRANHVQVKVEQYIGLKPDGVV